MGARTFLGMWTSAVIAALTLATGAPAQAPSGAGRGPIVGTAVHHDTSPALATMPALPATAGPKVQELRRPRLPRYGAPHVKLGRDPVLQDFSGPLNMPSATSFDGVSNVNGVLPPDPNGSVGPNHYVQWVNLSFAVFSKAGALLYGPAGGNTLWQGFGGPCQTENGGDPIVLYDKQADRWFMSQLAYPNFPDGPFYQCIAVSQTGDPLGAFHRYAYVISATVLNDYPKFGVWPDGYYLAVNQFLCFDLFPPFGLFVCDWAGQAAFAFERDKMLSGQPAQMIGFTLPVSNLGGMLPADWDGPTPPPPGAPNVYVQADDDVWFSPALPQDRLQLWPFHVDWTNPALSTFGPNPPGSDLGLVLEVQPFETSMCFDPATGGNSPNCIPQPGFDFIGQPSPGLDALADRLMYRLQYRNFGTYQTLVVNHTVDVDGTDHAGIRWYELRDAGSGWSVYQQGTYAPDSRHRWMGSIAMDGAGNIALGFSLSSRDPDGTGTYPSVVYVGRLAADPLGTLPQAETTMWAGNGAQEDSSGRWGDYSSMSVDSTDDCTFWYTHEYYPSTDVIQGINWRTRIGSFKFASCGGTPTDTPPVVSVTSPANGATVSGTVPVTASASDDHGVTRVEFFVDGVSIGVDTDGSNGWSASWNTTTATNGGHTVTATATDTVGQTASDAIPVTVANDFPPTVSITSPASGASVAGTIPVTASATDDHGVTQVEFFVDGASIGVDTDGSDGWSASWNTTTATNGGHTVSATATDTIGQTASSSNPVNVANASATSMGVFSIGWGTGRNLTVTVKVRRDSNASGGLTSGDLAVNGASVALVLTRDSNGSGTFECGGADTCWTFSGSTNNKGQVSFKLIGAPAGLYQARVTGLTHGSYTWNASLDLDNPDTFTK